MALAAARVRRAGVPGCLALLAQPVGNAQVLVDSHRQVTDHRVGHPQAAIDFLHQFAGPGDGLDDIRPLAVMANLVGQLSPSPVLGLVEGSAEALDDLLDLGVQVGNLLFARLRRNDVDELVQSVLTHGSPYGLSGDVRVGDLVSW